MFCFAHASPFNYRGSNLFFPPLPKPPPEGDQQRISTAPLYRQFIVFLYSKARRFIRARQGSGSRVSSKALQHVPITHFESNTKRRGVIAGPQAFGPASRRGHVPLSLKKSRHPGHLRCRGARCIIVLNHVRISLLQSPWPISLLIVASLRLVVEAWLYVRLGSWNPIWLWRGRGGFRGRGSCDVRPIAQKYIGGCFSSSMVKSTETKRGISVPYP